MTDVFNEEVAEQKATLADLQTYVKEYRDQRLKCDEIEETLKEENKKLDELEGRVFTILQDNKQKSIKTEFGLVGYKDMVSFQVPKDVDKKLKFLDYLKSEGCFEQYVTVNSQSLNSFLKEKFSKELDLKQELNLPPGIEKPNEFKQFYFRKK